MLATWAARRRVIVAWALVAVGLLFTRVGELHGASELVGAVPGPGLIVGVEDRGGLEHRAAPLSLPITPPRRAWRLLRSLGVASCALGLLYALQRKSASRPVVSSTAEPRAPSGLSDGPSGPLAPTLSRDPACQPERETPRRTPVIVRQGARALWAAPGAIGISRLVRPEEAVEGGFRLAALLLLLSLSLLAAWRD